MIALTWRQHRAQLLTAAALLTALSAYLLFTTHQMTSYMGSIGLSACLAGHGNCDIQAEAFLARFGNASHVFSLLDLVPLLAARGVVLSREQVYRLVAKVPERLSLNTLAALCDILECSPTELIEVVHSESKPSPAKPDATRAAARDIRPRRARVSPDAKR